MMMIKKPVAVLSLRILALMLVLRASMLAAWANTAATEQPLATLEASAQAVPVGRQIQEIDRIVAVVNKNVVTWLDLKKRMGEIVAQLQAHKVPLPARDVLQRQVLEQMIAEEVQLQFAASNGIKVDDDEIDRSIAGLVAQNQTTLEQLKAKLLEEGLSFDYLRNEIRNELTWNALKNIEFGNRIQVSDTEVDQVLKSAQSGGRVEYQLANILISVPERADAKQVEALEHKAQQALSDLGIGQSFAKVAATYSDGQNALKGGDMGWRSVADLSVELVQLLEPLQNGQHTGVVRTPQGFFIFQKLGKRDRTEPKVEQYHLRHILVRTNEITSADEAKAQIDQIRNRIMQGMPFAEAAKLYSDDGSKTDGGELGWVAEGDMLPEFKQAVASLSQAEVSQPVHTSFGWHLIQVEGQRSQDMSQDRERQTVKQRIQARKMEQAYADWVRQLRDSAFVEERLDEQ